MTVQIQVNKYSQLDTKDEHILSVILIETNFETCLQTKMQPW